MAKASAAETDTTETVGNNDGFVSVQTKRYMYNVEKCKAKPLQGHLLTTVAMTPINGRPWFCFLIRTTAPTLGVDKEDNVIELGVGEDVLIPATRELLDHLTRPAMHPRAVFEVKITPESKHKLDRQRSMWLFDIQTKPMPVPRVNFGVAALVGEKPVATLASADATGYDDIPF